MALTKEAVVDTALSLGDTEGLGAVTIRRLAQELGVTPMALYWHFKNKDQLFIAMIDELMAGACVDKATEPWQAGIQQQVDALTRSMRAHPYMHELLHVGNKIDSRNFAHATESALAFLTRAGFPLTRAYQVASYLLQGICALVENQPSLPAWHDGGLDEWSRQLRRSVNLYPRDECPLLVAFSESIDEGVDLEEYFRFGVETLLVGVEAMAAKE
ncbi:hypothetical protein GCM10027589_05710 [Actinocorallia lasiicapitis]